MFLVAGLGNPGEEYALSPHNLGFLTVDRLAERHGIRVTRRDSQALVGVGEIDGQKVMLAKPQTYMNLSGDSLSLLMQKHEIELGRLIVVYDELDLPWMDVRIKPKGSAAGHNGMKSVIQRLKTNEIVRMRLGIHPGHKLSSGADFVLAPIKLSQRKELEELVDYAADAVRSIIAEGVEKAMTKYNRRAQGLNNEEARIGFTKSCS
jgi:PTH1 family peptidyl-tRNA hydrolase